MQKKIIVAVVVIIKIIIILGIIYVIFWPSSHVHTHEDQYYFR